MSTGMSTGIDVVMLLFTQCPQMGKLFQKCFSGNVLTDKKNLTNIHVNFPSLQLMPILKIRITAKKG